MIRTLTAAALTLTALTAAPGFAGNAGASLGACYNHVISACNANSNHPEACATSGMDACDELHGASAAIQEQGIKMFKAPVPGGYRFVLAGQRAQPLWSSEDNGGRTGGGYETPGRR